MRDNYKKFFLPGFVFQSVIVGGGYGTGREIVEFFLSHGPVAGILGMLLVTTTVWSVFLALIFEFTRKYRVYNYKDFFRQLLGRFWFVFEIIFILYVLIVLAVLSSASGVVFRDDFELPYILGAVIMVLLVGIFTYQGSGKIEKFLTWWSFLLYAVYFVFVILAFVKYGDRILDTFAGSRPRGNWGVPALKYAFYNLANVVGVIFCIRHIETRKEAFTAGIIAGIIGIIPALLLYVSMTSFYPEIISAEIPSLMAFRQMGIGFLLISFQIVLFGTLIETGTALIHSFNERIFSSGILGEGQRNRILRPVIAVTFLLLALGLSFFGIIDLIARGYGLISWGFLLVFLLPMSTIGVYKIIKKD